MLHVTAESNEEILEYFTNPSFTTVELCPEYLTECCPNENQYIQELTTWNSVGFSKLRPINHLLVLELGQYLEENEKYQNGWVLELFDVHFYLLRKIAAKNEDLGTPWRDYLLDPELY